MFANMNGKQTYFEVNNLFYKLKDLKPTFVFLHGWGGSVQSFRGAFNYFSNLYPCLLMDFWGFGQSDRPNSTYQLLDYVIQVNSLLEYLKINKAILVGHSFGGRVAIKLLSYNNSNIFYNLILTGSAGIKPKFSFIRYFKIKKHKIKKIFVKFKVLKPICLTNDGSMDYKLVNKSERGVFVRIVNTFLEQEIKQISIPTLLLWGNKDKETPKYMAKKMNRLISKSSLIFLNGGHYAYVENHNQFCHNILKFLGE